MQRGVIIFTNSELDILSDLLVYAGDDFIDNNEELIEKFSPVDGSASSTIFVNEDEVETILDLMPIPDKDDDPNLVNARIKLQQFLSKN